jgi:hypothetical protein
VGRIALVFVHGFLSSVKVWSAFTELIEADSELRAGFDVRPFEYASPLATWGWRRIPDVDVVAVKLGTFLAIDLAK